MYWSFRNRITWIHTIAVAIVMAIVFTIIYLVVSYSSTQHLDNDIITEKNDIFKNIIHDKEVQEWNESEHQKMESNPIFIQISDEKGNDLFTSKNLNNEKLEINTEVKKDYFFSEEINNQKVRLGQFYFLNQKTKKYEFLTVAVSQQESFVVLNNLKFVLILSFAFVLFILFVVIWLSTSQAIVPVKNLIEFASSIDENSLDQRIPLPEIKDEIYQLSFTINEFIARVQKSNQQQRQFTADVSHELRTPLTAIKGTLEVLLRKDREPAHYKQKIEDVLEQTNKITNLYNEILLMAKMDISSPSVELNLIQLNPIINTVLSKFEKTILDKDLEVNYSISNDIKVYGQETYLEIIISNLISNAIKYNFMQGKIDIVWHSEKNILNIFNTGIGIPKEQIPYIFDRFYRVDSSRNSGVKGYGIGLSIVQKLCALQHIEVSVHSDEDKGCNISLHFTQN